MHDRKTWQEERCVWKAANPGQLDELEGMMAEYKASMEKLIAAMAAALSYTYILTK